MKNARLFVFIFVLFVSFFPGVVFAKCDSKDEVRLSKLASYITNDYKYEGDSYYFTVTFNNVHSDLVINFNGRVYKPSEGKVVVKRVISEKINQIVVYGTGGCNKPILDLYVNLPVYNIYNSKAECSVHPDFKYCAKFLESSINEEIFNEAYAKYMEKIEVDDFVEKDEVSKKKSVSFFDFYLSKDNLIYTGVSILLLVFICFLIKKIVEASRIKF